ncbi:MAG TPA: DUF3995 domain-containing protein [Tepidiformaceae bacterium]|nr:DUF3995 domain-containing protein [Tepidiformaceae bacterium]
MLTRLTAPLLLGIAAIHVYWAAGGRMGADSAVPSRGGVKTQSPGPIPTLSVAGGLIAMAAAVELARRGRGGAVARLVALLSALIFSARSVGDFRLVGLTKRERGTAFARNDTLLYTPLCMALSAGCLVAARGAKGVAAA